MSSKNRQVYLITGASSDLGIALLEKLPLGQDDLVIAHYHSSKKRLEKLAERRKLHMEMLQADFSISAACASFVSELKELPESPTNFIHICAPPPQPRRFKETDLSVFQRDFAVQTLSAAEILQYLLPGMVKKKSGNIVFVLTSYVVNKPPKFMGSYVTSKYALMGLMKAIVSEYAEKNIRVNAVAPSMMETKFLADSNPKIIEANAFQNPLQRNAGTSDVVPTLLLLLGEENSFINGAIIPITGGSEF